MSGSGPVNIAEVLRDARLGDLRNVREERAPYDLFETTKRLFELLESRAVAYLLVGGIAMLQYVESRNTRDIDLIMSAVDLARVPEFHELSRDADFGRFVFEGVQVNLLLTSNPVFQLAQAKYATEREFAERTLRTATPAGLVLLKLFALPSLYRQGDVNRAALYETDIRMLLNGREIDTEQILAELDGALLSSDIEALRRMLLDLRRRRAGFD
jgi:hypothetical protein